MQKAQEAAAEAKAQGSGGFRLVGKGGIIELQFFQRFPQIRVLGAIRRINAAEHHGIDLPVAGQCFGGGAGSQRDGVAHAGIGHCLDAGGEITDLTSLQLGTGERLVAPMWPTSTSVNSAPVAIIRTVSPGLTVPSKTRT